MPRSRSRNKRRRPRPAIARDSLVLLDLLDVFEGGGEDEEEAAAEVFMVLELFRRALWSFHAGPDAWYMQRGSISRALATLRAREWFLFEFELPSGMTAAEEWALDREGEPGTAGQRRAVKRFLDSECGVFDVEEERADGWLQLARIPDREKVLARPIDRGSEMIPGGAASLPSFAKGETIVTRLYWLEDGRAELSAASDRIDAEARAALLADPPEPGALRSALVLESLFGADSGRLLAAADDPRFPLVADDLLDALSDATFDYERLWHELEGEAEPVAVARQLLSELDQWSAVEQELLACAVVGAWLRQREAAAGRPLTPETLERERRVLEEHVRTILDVPAEPVVTLPPGARPLSMAPEDLEEVARLPREAARWVVDILPDDRRASNRIHTAGETFPLVCLIVEEAGEFERGAEDDDLGSDEYGAEAGQPDDFEEDDVEEDLDEEEDGLEDEEELAEEDEHAEGFGVPRLIEEAHVPAGEDEAQAALDLLVDALRGREEGLGAPSGIVFRQRRVAARLAGTLREAGVEATLRYLTGAVEDALLHEGPNEGENGDDEEYAANGERPAQPGEPEPAPGPAFSAEERASHARLAASVVRARPALDSLASLSDESAIRVVPDRPVPLSFSTLEGREASVGAFAIVPRGGEEGLTLDVTFLPAVPGATSDLRGLEGEELGDYADRVRIEVGKAEELTDEYLADLAAGGWPCENEEPCVVAVREQLHARPVFVRGLDLAIVAGLVEAVSVFVASQDEEEPQEETAPVRLHAEPLGDVSVSWHPGYA